MAIPTIAEWNPNIPRIYPPRKLGSSGDGILLFKCLRGLSGTCYCHYYPSLPKQSVIGLVWSLALCAIHPSLIRPWLTLFAMATGPACFFSHLGGRLPGRLCPLFGHRQSWRSKPSASRRHIALLRLFHYEETKDLRNLNPAKSG